MATSTAIWGMGRWQRKQVAGQSGFPGKSHNGTLPWPTAGAWGKTLLKGRSAGPPSYWLRHAESMQCVFAIWWVIDQQEKGERTNKQYQEKQKALQCNCHVICRKTTLEQILFCAQMRGRLQNLSDIMVTATHHPQPQKDKEKLYCQDLQRWEEVKHWLC